jgi:hypothetical protein
MRIKHPRTFHLPWSQGVTSDNFKAELQKKGL